VSINKLKRKAQRGLVAATVCLNKKTVKKVKVIGVVK
jgi:hypothetical protein